MEFKRVEKRTVTTELIHACYGIYYILMLMIGYIPSVLMRRFFYRLSGMKIGKNSIVQGRGEFSLMHNLTIGNNSIVGMKCTLDARKGITIGSNVNFSSEVAIYTLQHDPQSSLFETKGGPVVIHDYAWISFRVTILPNVTIGKGSVVAANSVVTKDVPEYSIVAGIPAKVIGKRTKNLHYTLNSDGFIYFI